MRRSAPMRLARSALPGTLICAGLPALIHAAVKPARAGMSDAGVRAVNTARDWGIHANGSLSGYVPATCLIEPANGGDRCLVDTTPRHFFFRLVGGPPGWLAPGRPTGRSRARAAWV